MDWNRLTRITAPPEKPLTLDEARAHLRVETTLEDDLILRLIDTATSMVDGPHGIGIAMVDQQWELKLDYFPPVIRIPLHPVRTVDAIEYVDDAGSTQTLAASRYQSDTNSNPARIMPAYNELWPTIRWQFNAVTVRFTAGYAPDGQDNRANIPQDLRSAMLLLVGHLYNNREAVVLNATATELPLAVDHILNQYRAGRVA